MMCFIGLEGVKLSAKKIVYISMLVSQALVLNIIESFIPVPIPVPGIKIGLANIVTLVTILMFGFKDSLIVVVLRTLLAQLLVGNITAFLFSVSGGILSACIMYIVYKRYSRYFSLVGVSVFGSVAHNVGQLFVASIVINNFLIFSYLPVLMISGIIMGIFTGLVANFFRKYIKNIEYNSRW
ncbi:Gx transporter family protein [Thermoanaerobacterium thermosaccharolyticum]|jgi:Heptaprenyl diphosphate synthase component I.|uniref:Gx transporter family protein n=1 Tax=Thermoanaerobacterium thermosaccharolyticum TaxID=1517 RepID=UPI0037DA6308